MASTSTAAAFFADFARLKADVVAALESPAPSSAAPAPLAALRAALAEVRGSLPAYDQRSYDLQVKDLEAKLAASRADKKPKFAFKRTPKSATPSACTSASASATATPAISTPAVVPSPPPAPVAAPPAPPTYTLSDRTGERLSEADISPDGTYTLTLSNLTSCVVDLRPLGPVATLTSLHASGLDDCLLIAPRMAGSAMLSGLSRTLVVLGAQQFRLHHSRSSAVALSVGSLPVIEGCNGIVFASYPATMPVPEAYASDGDKYAQVQDFDWVRSGPSPHWSLGGAEHKEQITQALVAAERGDTAAEALQTIPCIQRYTN